MVDVGLVPTEDNPADTSSRYMRILSDKKWFCANNSRN